MMVANTQIQVPQQHATHDAHSHHTESHHHPLIGPVVESIMLICLLVFFNAFPNRIGIYLTADDATSFVPLLAPEFQQYLPWLNMWWGCALTLKLIHIGFGQWHLLTRWADVAVNLLAIGVLLELLIGAPVIGIDPTWVAEHQAAIPALAPFAEKIVPMLVLALRFVFGVALFGTVIDTIQKVVRSLQATLFMPPLDPRTLKIH